MKREYDRESIQMQIKSILEGLNLEAFIPTRSPTTYSERLTKIVEHIELLTPQCPAGFRSE